MIGGAILLLAVEKRAAGNSLSAGNAPPLGTVWGE
ncbi:hypothetical protein LTSERUB_5483, partial [Salmonella enterica subsp. enterica serovar Rubislaw str. A4-653]